ncbi:MAG: MtnX-like HAD-IB family phosphatase [Anaeromyxobacter sp.]
MRSPWAIVCDFDGTALSLDLGDRVAWHFAGEAAYQAAEDAYLTGRCTFGELLAKVFAPITASREEIAAFARRTAVLRPGFERFVEACRAGGAPFYIVSSGLDAYIEPVIGDLRPALRDHIAIRANRAITSPEGLEVEFDGTDCGFCGFCKGHVVEDLKASGHRVVLLGDGTGDRHAADVADHVFARAGSSLVRYCAEKGLRHDVFETFDEVIERWPA